MKKQFEKARLKLNADVHYDFIAEKLLLSNSENQDNHKEILRYLKMVYTTKEKFYEDSIESIINRCEEGVIEKDDPDFQELLIEWWKKFQVEFETAAPFSFKEAFEIKNETIKSLVFGVLDIEELIENLNGKRIASDGRTSVQYVYDEEGNKVDETEITNVFEVYECDSKILTEQDTKVYAVKCWCTSTNKAHYIWINEEYKNDPLAAIASTFFLPKEILEGDKIKNLKRQGDILIVELYDKDYQIKEPENTIPLTKEQYFGKLVCQA